VDPHGVKAVPGRKRDWLDCPWLHKLHTYGLRHRAFRPAPPIRRLRTLTPQRAELGRCGATHLQHLGKALSAMNLHLQWVVSDLHGDRAMRIIEALLNGERDPSQGYLDRWQIEVNHREVKSNFGVGDAQVRNPQSVPRHPAFVVAIYAMMLLAAQEAYGSRRGEAYVPLPKWRKGAKRPSCQDIVSELRREMESEPAKLRDFAIQTGVMAAAAFRAAA
jgi:hypothetical protein